MTSVATHPRTEYPPRVKYPAPAIDILAGILQKYRIPVSEWPEWIRLTKGIRPSFAPLAYQGKRGKALNAILVELSKGVKHKFPPKDWRQGAPIPRAF
jgi:hypothetical protein